MRAGGIISRVIIIGAASSNVNLILYYEMLSKPKTHGRMAFPSSSKPNRNALSTKQRIPGAFKSALLALQNPACPNCCF